MSKTEVPSKLSNLWERYKLEQERAGKSVHKNSGFAGTGFKFDEAEKQMDKDRKNMQKAALGLAVSSLDFFLQFIENFKDSDDEDVSNVDIDKQIEQIFNSKKSVKETMVGAQEGADSKLSEII